MFRSIPEILRKIKSLILIIIIMAASLWFAIHTPQAVRRVTPDAVIMPRLVVQLTVEELIDRNMAAGRHIWWWTVSNA
jgi:hypothetical protein